MLIQFSHQGEVGQDSLLQINLGDSHFPWFFGAVIQGDITRRLSGGLVKRSLRVWIQKYSYLKWSSRLNRFGISIFQYTIFNFQSLKRRICKIQCKPKSHENSKNGKMCPTFCLTCHNTVRRQWLIFFFKFLTTVVDINDPVTIWLCAVYWKQSALHVHILINLHHFTMKWV